MFFSNQTKTIQLTIFFFLGISFHKTIAKAALELIQPKISAFEEQVSQIREDLASVYEDENEYTEAAKTLAAIPLESGQRYES